ncbi:hypothetical protein [Azospirillum argentinense]
MDAQSGFAEAKQLLFRRFFRNRRVFERPYAEGISGLGRPKAQQWCAQVET